MEQAKGQQVYFPFYDDCKIEKEFYTCEREILEREILNLITPETESNIIANFTNSYSVLTLAFVFQDNNPIREDIDIDFSDNDLKEKLKNFLLQLEPFPKNDSINNQLKVRHHEFVFYAKENKTLLIANDKMLKELSYKSDFKFGIKPRPYECTDSNDYDRCINTFISKHIIKNLIYPDEAIDNGLEGTVECDFYIDKEGFVNVKKTEGPYGILEKEAERIIRKLPRFIPGSVKDIPSAFSFRIPITYSIN